MRQYSARSASLRAAVSSTAANLSRDDQPSGPASASGRSCPLPRASARHLCSVASEIPSSCDNCRMAMLFGGSIRFSTADFRFSEYPKSSTYPAHLRNRGKVEQRTTSMTQGDKLLRHAGTFDENSTLNSRHRCGLCCHHFDRDARDWQVGSKTGGQFNWFGPDGASVRAMARKIIHSGWQKNSEGCSLYASIGGHETQSRPQGQISSADQSRKATKRSPNGAHAKTNRTRQRPYQSRSKLGERRA